MYVFLLKEMQSIRDAGEVIPRGMDEELGQLAPLRSLPTQRHHDYTL